MFGAARCVRRNQHRNLNGNGSAFSWLMVRGWRRKKMGNSQLQPHADRKHPAQNVVEVSVGLKIAGRILRALVVGVDTQRWVLVEEVLDREEYRSVELPSGKGVRDRGIEENGAGHVI